ncbi:MAG: TRAP transporter small permease [Rhizobiaceae bacterium]
MHLPRLVSGLARWLAMLGGFVLVALAILTCLSIVDRAVYAIDIGLAKIVYELIEAGVGFAVFAFLPWCQLNRGHATVDLFTNILSAGANRVIDLLSEILMLVCIGLIAWRLWVGTLDKYGYGETTFILEMPLWWAYAACMAAAAVAVVVAVFMVLVRFREVMLGRPLLAPSQGAQH